MSKKYKVELNGEGVKQLLKGSAVNSILMQYGSTVQQSAGEEYEAKNVMYPTRAAVIVRAATPHAYYSNKKHNTLLKALGSARGK